MFALTTHIQQADARAREHRNIGMIVVMLTGVGAIGAGLLMNAVSSLSAFASFVPV
jgi:hypothetical protein